MQPGWSSTRAGAGAGAGSCWTIRRPRPRYKAKVQGQGQGQLAAASSFAIAVVKRCQVTKAGREVQAGPGQAPRISHLTLTLTPTAPLRARPLAPAPSRFSGLVPSRQPSESVPFIHTHTHTHTRYSCARGIERDRRTEGQRDRKTEREEPVDCRGGWYCITCRVCLSVSPLNRAQSPAHSPLCIALRPLSPATWR